MARKVEQTINNNKSRFVTFRTMQALHRLPFKHLQDVKKAGKTIIKNNPDVSSGDSPVSNSTHINLKVAVVSQQPILHLDQIDRMVIQSQ